VQRSIEREFDRWDGILSYQLDQLAEALTLKQPKVILFSWLCQTLLQSDFI